MDAQEAIQKARQLIAWCRIDGEPVPVDAEAQARHFGEWAQLVAYAVRDGMTQRERDAIPWLKEWAVAWRKLHDAFDREFRADPMIMYEPANHAALAFHSSPAFVRYFRAGNRTSKTQSGCAEHAYYLRGRHPYRVIDRSPSTSTFVIGVNFSKYLPNVFLKKFLTGEDGNYLTPMFPEDGKWFNRWDARTHTLWLGCEDCANKGRAQRCKHQKRSVTVFSDMEGWEVLQGAQYQLGHFDEHISEDFFNEALQRTQALKRSGLIVTGTPLHGYEAWEYRRLAQVATGPEDLNHMVPGDPTSPPFVTMHEISQFDAGIVSHDKIRMSMASMDEFEIEARVFGRPAPLAKNPVFDRKILAEMREQATSPKRRVDLVLVKGVDLEECNYPTDLEAQNNEVGPLRIYQEPDYGAQYILGVDTAAGLAPGGKTGTADASCAQVLKLLPQADGTTALRTVAQYYDYINPLDYGGEVKKVACFYNRALVVIELTGGLGRACMLRLRELNYDNIYRDQTRPEVVDTDLQYRYGVETSAASKPLMVSALQQLIRKRRIEVPCRDTLAELAAFEQERTASGLQVRYRGAGGSHDDRVMALVVGAYVACTFPVYDFLAEANDPETWEEERNMYWKSTDDARWEEVRRQIDRQENPDIFGAEV